MRKTMTTTGVAAPQRPLLSLISLLPRCLLLSPRAQVREQYSCLCLMTSTGAIFICCVQESSYYCYRSLCELLEQVPCCVFVTVPSAATNIKEELSKEKPRRDSEKSSPGGSSSGGAGPPNLPPRLVKKQQEREERMRRISGGQPPSPTSTRPPQQPPAPYSGSVAGGGNGGSAAVSRQPRPVSMQQQQGGGRYFESGPSRGAGGMRDSTGYHQQQHRYRSGRIDYQQKRTGYDPQSRGPMSDGKMLWTEENPRRGGYSRGYNDRYDNRNYGPPNMRRGGHNPRFPPGGGGYHNYGGPRQPYREPNSQYSSPAQYTGPPSLNYPTNNNNKYNNNNEHSQMNNRSYKQGRHQQPPPPQSTTSTESEPPSEGNEELAVVTVAASATHQSTEASAEQKSPATLESASSTTSDSTNNVVDEAVVASQQATVSHTDPSAGNGYAASDSAMVSQEAQYEVVAYDDPSIAAAGGGGDGSVPTYVYGDCSDMQALSQAGAGTYVQMPPGMVSQMQGMSLQNAPVSTASMQHYPSVQQQQPGVVLDHQMYAPVSAYNPAVHNMEYSASAVSMPEPVTSPNSVLNGSSHKVWCQPSICNRFG